jgi:uncharacterized alkaline shock family protein YloU
MIFGPSTKITDASNSIIDIIKESLKKMSWITLKYINITYNFYVNK